MKRYYYDTIDTIKDHQIEIVPISNLGGANSLQRITRHIWPLQIQNNCTKITAKVKHRFTMEDNA